jgi:shikimate 5-dehydrogenase
MNKILIFGHRGVGKSAFLERCKDHYKNKIQNFFDLDQQIANFCNKSIADIFKQDGEAQFRVYEKQVFQRIYKANENFVISVGGGFPVDEVPQDIHCIWLQRVSDQYGRIFFDRPRLEPGLSDLEEFLSRAKVRDDIFKVRADEKYLMPEGLGLGSSRAIEIEAEIFSEKIIFPESSYFTIQSNLISSAQIDFSLGSMPSLEENSLMKNSSHYLEKTQNSGWELRDDLLSAEQINTITELYHPRSFLVSFRSSKLVSQTEALLRKLQIQCTAEVFSDWALELGSPQSTHSIISLHEYLPNENLDLFLVRLEFYSSGKNHLKASPIIDSWSELEKLWLWQLQDPANRSVLPRSQEGRWCWFRLFMQGRQKINFWKDSEGSALDQPSLFQWLGMQRTQSATSFSAILGSPVHLSQTPIEQMDFFSKMNCPVFAIELSEEEWAEGFATLDRMGLIAAAVTSPLKKTAMTSLSEEHLRGHVKQLGALNTLKKVTVGHETYWTATNTDLYGFKALADEAESVLRITQSKVVVWGGGGTLPVIREVYPDCIEYSLRTGRTRKESNKEVEVEFKDQLPQILVWAAGPESPFPPESLQPQLVIDLNYREDSQARAYAKNQNAIYISGLKMFKVQALYQREFWCKK